jgi:fructokinase
MISGVGDDDLGRRALKRLRSSSIDVTFVAVDPQRPTGSVAVSLDAAGHASYRFHEHEAWDHLVWSTELAELASRCEAVCFGTLGQRSSQSRETIQRFVAATDASALRVFDINLREPFFELTIVQQSLELANVVKLNDDELAYLARELPLRAASATDQARELCQRFNLRLVAVTRGKQGALVVGDEVCFEAASQPTEVVDSVGAGDSFTAALVMGMLRGLDLQTTMEVACRIAEFVCRQSGGTPELPAPLVAKLSDI